MTEFLQHLINGLSMGSIYALIALGYTMVFGVLKLINFAHGDIYMLGSFAGFYTIRWLGIAPSDSLLQLLVVLLAAMTVSGLIGFCIEKLAYRPLRKAPRINILITAVGVSMLLEFSGQLLFGSDPKFFPQIYTPAQVIKLGALTINPMQLVVCVISLLLMLVLQYIVFYTRIGRAMRAVSFNHELAQLMGISADRVISFTFILGSCLAGAAGVLVGLTYPKIEPLMGVAPGLKAFSAAVLGGIGNVTGAVVGALLLGFAEEFVVGYGGSSFRDAIAFGILIFILLYRPTGLFGIKHLEKV